MTKTLFFIFLGIIIVASTIVSLPMISATGFSPSSLIFNLTQNDKECKMITITSDSSLITVDDKWAENKDVNWSVSKFNQTAGSHGITISYPANLTSERQVNVCVSGSDLGEYHGVILLREQQEGNSIIQMGVWVKLNVNQASSQPSQPQQQTITGGGGGAGITTGSVMLDVMNNSGNTNANENSSASASAGAAGAGDEKITQEEIDKSKSAGITGSAIGFLGDNKMWTAIIFIAAIGIAALFVYNKRRKQSWENQFQAQQVQ